MNRKFKFESIFFFLFDLVNFDIYIKSTIILMLKLYRLGSNKHSIY